MGKNKEIKTNVMRVLDQKKIEYKTYDCEDSGLVAGKEVADFLGLDQKQMFKTLVTVAPSKVHYVFIVPVEAELDLKKAANSVKEKSIEMIPLKELLPLTGYVHGGCSPIGMKKLFKTVLDDSSKNFDSIVISAGKVGHFVLVKLTDLQMVIPIEFFELKK